MAVSEDVSGYSTTAASNTPGGSDNVGPDLDNHLRDIKKNIRHAAEHFRTLTDENFKGRFKYDSAGVTVDIKVHDGTDDISMLRVDESANTSFPFVGSRVMTALGAGIVDKTATASALNALGLSAPGTAGNAIFQAEGTASAHSVLGVGTDIGDLVELVTASATAVAGLPAVRGDRLTGLAQAATQAEMETGVSTTVYVSPGRQHFHPGMAKVWGFCIVTTGVPNLDRSYNVTSITDGGGGKLTVTIATNFSSAEYAILPSVSQTTGSVSSVFTESQAAGSFDLENNNTSGGGTDPAAWSFAAYGDQ